MLKLLPAPLKGIFNILFIFGHTLFWCAFLYLFYGLKLIYRSRAWQARMEKCCIATANLWIQSNNWFMDATLSIDWQIHEPKVYQTQPCYFVIANHQSWTDILLLQRFFLNKIPFIRFFIKKELIWLPVINLAWWAFDFPIMHRHSKAQIEKNPQLRHQDFQTTQKACQRYQHKTVTVLNFLEGTRFSTTKQRAQKSPFSHLLVPKSGGFAYALNAMDQSITHVLDVTISYHTKHNTFWDFLCGKIHKITITIHEYPIPSQLLRGDYFSDESYREQVKSWVQELWQHKDHLLDKLQSHHRVYIAKKNEILD